MSQTFEQSFAAIFGVPPPKNVAPIPRPDALDVIDMNNHAINEIRDSAERAEETGELPRMDYGRLSRKEIEEGNQAADRG